MNLIDSGAWCQTPHNSKKVASPAMIMQVRSSLVTNYMRNPVKNIGHPGGEVACIDAVPGRFEMLRLDSPFGSHSELLISQDSENPGQGAIKHGAILVQGNSREDL